MRRFRPGIADGSDLPSKQLQKGQSLRSICESLQVRKAEGAVLTSRQKQVQESKH